MKDLRDDNIWDNPLYEEADPSSVSLYEENNDPFWQCPVCKQIHDAVETRCFSCGYSNLI